MTAMDPTPITPTLRLRPSADALSRELDGELVVLHLGTEAYFGLDDVGTRIWQAVCAAPSVADAIDALAAEFDVARDELERDVLELAGQLVARGLLVVE